MLRIADDKEGRAHERERGASLPDLFGGAATGEFESLTNNPVCGLVAQTGSVKLTNVPGLGVNIDRAKLRETTGLWEAK
jgi:hypothetical protein